MNPCKSLLQMVLVLPCERIVWVPWALQVEKCSNCISSYTNDSCSPNALNNGLVYCSFNMLPKGHGSNLHPQI